ncbi:PrpF domain-containing protein [Streptomyces sp. NPDC051921]|uniref:PrpF domain-containing protein n=1 Tax=Streptomyces sp. NPDC051921 TaxID=3155806 RepID=UPI00342D8929
MPPDPGTADATAAGADATSVRADATAAGADAAAAGDDATSVRTAATLLRAEATVVRAEATFLRADATVVRAEDAPGPTLVVRLDRLPPGALASAGELAYLRRVLARTPYRDLNKIALYGPSRRPGAADLDYRFVQALPDGRFDFRTGCGHSLLACVVAEGRAGPVAVRALTTGDTVLCRPRGGAYDLDFLRAPTAPGTLPTGRPVDVLDGVPVSLVRYGNPYVLVDTRHLPAHGASGAHGVHDAPGLEARLLRLRAHAAVLLGHPPHSPLPKIAAFAPTPDGLFVRALTVGGWHPRLALTGAAAFAVAGAIDGTVVPGPVGSIRTPGGDVVVSTGPGHVRVHAKRAHLVDRLRLPWRVHATA